MIHAYGCKFVFDRKSIVAACKLPAFTQSSMD